MPTWKQTQFFIPPKGKELLTKIHDHQGERNVQKLTYDGRLWWAGPTYIYYTPTHWAEVEEEVKFERPKTLDYIRTEQVLDALEIMANYDGHPANVKSIARETLRKLGYNI